MNLLHCSLVLFINFDYKFWSTSYQDLKKGEKLKELQEKQSLLESQLQDCETRKPEIDAELEKSRDLKRNQDHLRRNIVDNLNYRKTKAEVDELTHEIESVEERILKIGGISTFESELSKLSQERDRLLSEVCICHAYVQMIFLFTEDSSLHSEE